MFNLPQQEQKILEFWEKEKIFEKSLAASKGKKPFVFYEGPPTANGKPGLHHVLARAYKDIILRYKTMQGFFVPRKAGWDTHGLPVELEVEKELGLDSKKEIEEYGIGNFMHKAKESVWRYKSQWELLTKRMGFWLDLEHPYITYETSYIESLWYIIATYWKKKLLQEDFKVVPWCYRCGTPLSSHELAQGYQKVADSTVYVRFKLKEGQKYEGYILAWTTTHWTLPGNIGLAVGQAISYAIARGKNTQKVYILAEDKLSLLEGMEEGGYELIKTVQGQELEGLSYEPIFNIPALASEHSFKVYLADFVTTEDGTGVVHTAAMYGEDDYQLAKKARLPLHHTVTPEGKFTDEVPQGFAGMQVKSQEVIDKIEAYLRQKDLLFKRDQISHDYPFCWRCKNPLLYYATKTWFVRVTSVKEKLIKNNESVNWIPDHLKHGRFGNFLSEVKDWAFSRERYWGTPLPVWKCQQCGQVQVIDSLASLQTESQKRNQFVLIRHCGAVNNEKDILSSFPEKAGYPLTSLGREQADVLAQALKSYHIDLIVASPVLRTRQTAEIIAKHVGAPVEIDEELREIDMGPFNGGPSKPYHEFWGSREARFTKTPLEGMENFHQLKKRVVKRIKELDAQHEGKTIAIVSHAANLWVLDGTLQGLSEDAIAQDFPEDFHTGEARVAHVALPFNEEGEVDLHRPYIDGIMLACRACKGVMKRVPEVADVWFDSGAMPFAQAHWPFERGQKAGSTAAKGIDFPADYISEAIDQTRGWFYTLLATSTLLGYKAPYKHVISLGHLLDEKGRKMSKSLGNIIDPFDAADQYGMDTIRWYFFVVNTPGSYKRFDPKEIRSHQQRFLTTLFNTGQFLQLYGGGQAKTMQARMRKITSTKPHHILDVWILSRLHSVIRDVTDYLEAYDITQSARLLEEFVDDLSNWYVRRSRERMQGKDAGPTAALLAYVLDCTARLAAPFVPFSGEILFREVLAPLGATKEESVHLTSWPRANAEYISKSVQEDMQQVRNLAALALAKRAEVKIKVRQPLSRLIVNNARIAGNPELAQLLSDEVNVKEIVHDPSVGSEVKLDTTLTPDLIQEGFVRELIRQVQGLRKDKGLLPKQKISLYLSDPALLSESWKSYVAQKINASAITHERDSGDTRELNFEGKVVTIAVDVA